MQLHFDDDTPVRVGLVPLDQRGMTEVANWNADSVVEKSTGAINEAMGAIQGIAKQVVATVRGIDYVDRPDTIDVKFGLKLTTDAKAFVVNAGVEAQIEVTLHWEKAEPD